MAPPVAMKFLIDDVVGKGRTRYLVWIVLGVGGASIFQQVTSYTLTQLFSGSTTRLIGELRRKLQAHVLRLSLTYHDKNKSGAVGSRIMNDVQGLQNLVGTGLLNYVGSLMTSIIAIGIMARFSLALTGIALGCIVAVGAHHRARHRQDAGRSRTSARASSPTSSAGSRRPSAACASSRPTAPRTARTPSSRRASAPSSTTSSSP